ncbi:MAG: acid phosphatase [Parahaliea sp.]
MLNKLAGIATLIALAGCTATQEPHTLSTVEEIRPGLLKGYLPMNELPDSGALLPAPPAPGSTLQAVDEEANLAYRPLRGTARWELAARDADLRFPAAASIFSCALDLPISEQQTPFLYRVLHRSLADAGLSTYTAKNKYQRPRPFMANGLGSCTPGEEEMLSKDGSYPSGHTALGWAWALLLAELAPERKDTIFLRGWAFGESREICNVHWNSDTDMGRMVGATAVAALHSNADFQADFVEAAREVSALRKSGATSPLDCEAERQALNGK